ncbi:Serine/threonine-protein kinase [Venturia nashicola]|uniref:Serine/threonine-protein kinase n=1 Tax=Venturia nashicola TaxID=86259 RepID=A0A4Z1NYJ5_9PEZI|nr:Serine/threonine-protein kinase [Venturia nashicola]TLD34479.1 Serine/threonine-protein kinase [Venturia nashicola]
MADALCGPSNALQQFQKHSSVDRSLQHDRLISRPGASQSFRSNLGSNQGALDPEFEAFQQGLTAHVPPQFDAHPVHQRFPQPQQSHFQAPSALPDWANDFQRLHISSPSPVSSQQSIRQAPVTRHSPQASWHQDFMSSQAPHMPLFQPMSSMSQGYSWNNGMQSPQYIPKPSQVAQGKQKVEDNTQFDAAAFEAAFDTAQADALAAEIQADREEMDALIAQKEAELHAQRHAQPQVNHLANLDLSQAMERDLAHEEPWPDNMATEYPQALMDELDQENLDRSYQQLQSDKEKHEPEQRGFTDEELARTAGALLDSVSHDTSTKFQESVFLRLMRKIRDHEVRVEGEHFVENTSRSGSASIFAQKAESLPLTEAWAFPEEDQEYDITLSQDWGAETEFMGDDMTDVELSTRINLPSRPLTPEIDPPAPTLEVWRERLDLPNPEPSSSETNYSSIGRWGPTPPPNGHPFSSPFE